MKMTKEQNSGLIACARCGEQPFIMQDKDGFYFPKCSCNNRLGSVSKNVERCIDSWNVAQIFWDD